MTKSSKAENVPFALDQDNTCVGSVSGRAGVGGYGRRGLPLYLFLLAATASPVRAWSETCTPFKEIYTGGKDLCERIFDDSFKYEVDEDKAYTMWWFDKTNPNEKTAKSLGLTVPDTCQLQYFHKPEPYDPEDDSFTECRPWKDNACCKQSTVASAEAIRTGYGAGYEWDRCGPMTSECSRFFVQEACMYECDVTAGLYRRCTDEQVAAAKEGDLCAGNTWQMYKMPIKASYCDAWYSACANDYFCNGGDKPGDFFSCDQHYWDTKAKDELAVIEAEKAEKVKLQAEVDTMQAEVNASLAVTEAEKAEKVKMQAEVNTMQAEVDASLPTYAVVIIILVVALIFLICIGYIIKREKAGQPMFMSLVAPLALDSVDSGGP